MSTGFSQPPTVSHLSIGSAFPQNPTVFLMSLHPEVVLAKSKWFVWPQTHNILMLVPTSAIETRLGKPPSRRLLKDRASLH
eukprot:COSAG06_NODE_14595_length_1144_cov_1.630622_1_plen_80_part_01